MENFTFSNGTFTAAQIVNDAPIGVDDDNSGDAVTEAGGTANDIAGDAAASGNVLTNDTDADLTLGDTKSITGARAGSETDAGSLTTVTTSIDVAGTYGTLHINSDGTYTYTLDNNDSDTEGLSAGQSVSDIFTYRVADAHGLTDTAQLTIAVTGSNDAPVLIGDLAAPILEGGEYTITGSDLGFTDPDDLGSDVTFTISSQDSGTILVDGLAATTFTGAQLLAGSVSFQHDGSETTSASFNVVVEDGNEDGSTPVASTFNLTVTPVNDEPSGADATVATNEDTAYTFAAVDFGFSDSDGNALLTVKITTLPAAGSLTLDGNPVVEGDFITATDIADGKLVFTPDADGNGSGYANFTFQVQDDGGTDNGGVDLDQTANTITIDVNAVNDEPSGADATVATNEDTAYTFVAADFGFSDSDGNALLTVKITTLPAAGSLTLDGNPVVEGDFITATDIADGKLVFTPDADGNGSGYGNFTFQVQDDGGTDNGGVDLDQTANTITIDVNAVDDPATAKDDAFTTAENAVLAGGSSVFADNGSGSDSDIDSTLAVTAVNGSAVSVGSEITLASGAHLTLNADGTFSYDPNHVFDKLPAAGSGAANTSGTDPSPTR